MLTREEFERRTGQKMAGEEFERQRGDPPAFRSRARSPFALVRPAPESAYVPGSPQFKNPTKFVEMLRAPFNLTAAAAAILVLPKVDQQRTILTLRNSSTSAGILFIGLGFPPIDASTALYELPAGGQMIFDVAVPQDEVWLFSIAGALGMVGYALGGMRLFKDQSEPGGGLMPKITLVARSGPFAGP